MTIEQIFICSKIFLAFAVFFIIIAVAFYFIFDIKRLIKILRGKACRPIRHKKERVQNKCDNKCDNKTELLPIKIDRTTEPLITMEIKSFHEDVAL
jgi:hypothetical protein